MLEMRKIITTREVILSELGIEAPLRVVRAVCTAVIVNPFVGRFVDDLLSLFEAGARRPFGASPFRERDRHIL